MVAAMTAIPSERPDYGIDAPGVVRNLFVAGALCLSAWAVVTFGRFSVPKFVLGLAGMAFGTGVLCMVMGLWMLWDSRVGKLRRREWLLNRVDWSGHEQVLDVGCGRGLLLIGATFARVGLKFAGWAEQQMCSRQYSPSAVCVLQRSSHARHSSVGSDSQRMWRSSGSRNHSPVVS